MIKMININKVYENDNVRVEALRGINLEVEKGDYIAVMGTSGSGKTTLLNIIGAMDDVTEGEYIYGDIIVSDLSKKELHKFRKNHISFVFQNFDLMDYYSVEENVEIPLIAKGISKKERKKIVNECMQVVGIFELKDKLPKHISGGQQQRCAIARALASQNELLLADEPTGALDKKTSEEIMKIFGQLNKQGKTIIVITHDPDVAKMANKVVRIEDGKIVE